MIISAHKTLAAFTQGAILLVRGDLLDCQRINAAFELLNTTSPSAAILGSIDRARQIMAVRGRELLGRTLALARRFRRQLADVDGLQILDQDVVARLPAVGDFDPLKLVLLLPGTGAQGFAVEDDLRDLGVRVEMADRDVLIPLLTIGDDEVSVDRLLAGLRDSLARRRGRPRPSAAASVWRVQPAVAMTPRDAFFAPRERVDAGRAIGRVSAEMAAPYPPGVPVLAPGEIITVDMLEQLRSEAAAGTRVAYCSDPTLNTMLVVQEG
jgi:lysine decarboxylase